MNREDAGTFGIELRDWSGRTASNQKKIELEAELAKMGTRRRFTLDQQSRAGVGSGRDRYRETILSRGNQPTVRSPSSMSTGQWTPSMGDSSGYGGSTLAPEPYSQKRKRMQENGLTPAAIRASAIPMSSRPGSSVTGQWTPNMGDSSGYGGSTLGTIATSARVPTPRRNPTGPMSGTQAIRDRQRAYGMANHHIDGIDGPKTRAAKAAYESRARSSSSSSRSRPSTTSAPRTSSPSITAGMSGSGRGTARERAAARRAAAG